MVINEDDCTHFDDDACETVGMPAATSQNAEKPDSAEGAVHTDS